MEAAWGGAAEVKLSQLATDRASHEEVRRFAQHMIHDHTQANQELRQLASSEGVTAPDELDQEHRNLMNRLYGLNGAEFDREYMDAMVQDHKKVVAEFEREASQGQDNELKHCTGPARYYPSFSNICKWRRILLSSIEPFDAASANLL